MAGSTVNEGEPCLQRRKVFSMTLARSHSARAHGFHRTARAIVALAQNSDLDFVFASAVK